MLLMLALLAVATPPDCTRPDGPGLCLGVDDLRARAQMRADLDLCLSRRVADTAAVAAMAQARAVAVEERDQATEALDIARRRRWRWVAAGAAGGVAVSAGVVWAGVQVVGAR